MTELINESGKFQVDAFGSGTGAWRASLLDRETGDKFTLTIEAGRSEAQG
ncbi:hypothetical protein [Streptomyces sp. URMC 123]